MFSRNIVDVMAQNELTPWFWPKSSGDFYTETNYNFPSTLDGNPVVKTFDNFTIGPTAVVTTQNRCKGLYLNILGDCHIDGMLSMTARGAKGAGTNIGILPEYGIFYANKLQSLKSDTFWVDDDNIIYAIKKQIPAGYKAKRQPGNGGIVGVHFCDPSLVYLYNNWNVYVSGTSFSGGSRFWRMMSSSVF